MTDKRRQIAQQLLSATTIGTSGRLEPVLRSHVPEIDQLQPYECHLQRQSSNEGEGKSQEEKHALVQVKRQSKDSNADGSDEFTRKVCCASFEAPPDASSIDIYYSRHQLERQHFDAPQSDIERSLREQLKAADAELKELLKNKQRVDHHIRVLHDYNEIKDVVQALMGKCAELEGRTTKDMYVKFGLDLED